VSNKVKFGLKNVHYAVVTETGGEITYDTPKPIPGAVSLTLNPRGERTDFYADDMLYYTSATNDGYEGDLEVALFPDEFKKVVLGYKEDANGVLFEDANAIPKNFALLFEFSGDKNAVRHVLYNVIPSRPNLQSSTKTNTSDPQTEMMGVVASPALDTGMVKAKVEPGQAQYDTWYSQVYTYVEPTGV